MWPNQLVGVKDEINKQMQNIKYTNENTQIHKYKYTTKGRTACVAQPACRADVRFRGKANLGCWSLLVGQIQTVAESETDNRVQLRVWYHVVWCVMVWYSIILYCQVTVWSSMACWG